MSNHISEQDIEDEDDVNDLTYNPFSNSSD